ncbi:MAG: AMP-binding protein [Leadbetterella sp.]
MATTNTPSFPWLASYVEGMPHTIDENQYESLVEIMEEGFKKYATHTACINMGKEMTFAEVDVLSKDLAAYFQSLGLMQGDRIAIQMPNCIQNFVAIFAAIRGGFVVVNTNPLYTPREMEKNFKDSGVKAIVIMDNFCSNLEAILTQTDIKHIVTTQLGDFFGFPKKQIVNFVIKNVKKMVPPFSLPHGVNINTALKIGRSHTYNRPNLKKSDLAFIQYTGGTTGVSKGAALSHKNIVCNAIATDVWQSFALKNIRSKKIILVAALPLYHIYALTTNMITALRTGCTNLLITNPRDTGAFIKDLKKYPPNVFIGLNTLYNSLLNHPKITEVDFSDLVISTAGGMALQNSVAERWKALTGKKPVEGYGLTETSPVLASNPIDEETNRLGTIGVPWPSTELRIMRDDGSWAETSEIGEICAWGPQVMDGYYNKPEETAHVMHTDPADGRRWFKTGDVGFMDVDGYFKIVDRKKDMILVSGFNVYPNEVEDVVTQLPGILEAACIGVPDAKSGEAVKLFVVKKDPNLAEGTIREFCKANLTSYKCPKEIEFRTELPKSNVGKILRKDLR